MEEISIRPATAHDEKAIKVLLKKAKLPFKDVKVGRRLFIVAEENNCVVGVVGLEIREEQGLLRSLAVEERYRGQGLGEDLLQEIIAEADIRGIKSLYLLTTTAEGFFAKRGFGKTDRASAPVALQQTTEFKSICPVSAACMKKEL